MIEHSTLAMAKKIDFPVRMVQGIVSVVTRFEARKKTLPDCPSVQNAPVVSKAGCIEVGMDTYHCHHASLQPMYPRPWALAFGGMMEEERPQQCEACIDCTKSLTLCAWFTYHTSIQVRTQIEVQLDY